MAEFRERIFQIGGTAESGEIHKVPRRLCDLSLLSNSISDDPISLMFQMYVVFCNLVLHRMHLCHKKKLLGTARYMQASVFFLFFNIEAKEESAWRNCS